MKCDYCNNTTTSLYSSIDSKRSCLKCYTNKLQPRQDFETEDNYFDRLPFDLEDVNIEEKRVELLNNPKSIPNKILVAEYKAYSTFVIPNDIDLDSPDIEGYGVKWDVLRIHYKNGETVKISAYSSASEYDFKYPTTTQIETANDNYEGYEDNIDRKTNL